MAVVDRVELDADTVHFTDGTSLGYDVLVIATDSVPLPAQECGGKVLGFHDLASATALRDALRRFDGGRLVVDLAGDPTRSGLPALEFCFLADAYFRRRRIRDGVDLAYLTPIKGALGRPVVSRALGQLLQEKWGKLVPGFATERIDAEHGLLHALDGRTQPFDLAVMVPPMRGAAYVDRSAELGDGLGFVPVDRRTLQSDARPNVFAIGAATDLPVIQSDATVGFQAEVLVNNLRRFLADEPLDASYDGKSTCVVNTGFGRALRVDSTYDAELRPSRENRLDYLVSWVARRRQLGPVRRSDRSAVRRRSPIQITGPRSSRPANEGLSV